MSIETKSKKFTLLFRERLLTALPTIAFFISIFLLVSALFGTQYTMAGISLSALFQIRRTKRNSLRDLAELFFGPVVLCCLAFLATQNVWLCILLNFIVPFLLVFLTSSQFAPKAYFGFAMTFIFPELRPPAPEEFPIQLLAMAFCSALLVIALICYSKLNQKPADPISEVARSLDRLANLLDALADGKDYKPILAEFHELAWHFHRNGYDRRRLLQPPDTKRQVYHMLGLLFQRAAYLIEDESWLDSQSDPAFAETMHTLAALVRRLRSAARSEERASLRSALQVQLSCTNLPEGRLRIFSRGMLHMLLLLAREKTSSPQRSSWQQVPWRAVLESLRQHFSLDRFEFRFALQLSVVMTVSCTASFLSDFEHAYWFPLHAFLLLQPSYEESARRMVTRPVGTVIGCVLVHLVSPHLPGLPEIFLFCLVMISLMYICTPGTWIQPIFSTSFALTMAALSLGTTEAIRLRLFYLGIAVALVLVVNRFLLPNRREQLFHSNIKELFVLQADYWCVIQRSLRGLVYPGLLSELLSQFHLIYHEAAGYLKNLPSEESSIWRTRLLILWNMFSELEQVECLIQTRSVSDKVYPALNRLADQIQSDLRSPHPTHRAPSLEDFPRDELYYVLDRYLQNSSRLT